MMKYNAKFTKIEDGYYRAKINNVELWEVDELLVWTIKEREKEIERLTKRLEEAQLAYLAVEEKNKKLHSIIKEVRENINKKLNVNSDYVDYDFGTELLRQELLEILDKVGSDKE